LKEAGPGRGWNRKQRSLKRKERKRAASKGKDRGNSGERRTEQEGRVKNHHRMKNCMLSKLREEPEKKNANGIGDAFFWLCATLEAFCGKKKKMTPKRRVAKMRACITEERRPGSSPALVNMCKWRWVVQAP